MCVSLQNILPAGLRCGPLCPVHPGGTPPCYGGEGERRGEGGEEREERWVRGRGGEEGRGRGGERGGEVGEREGGRGG